MHFPFFSFKHGMVCTVVAVCGLWMGGWTVAQAQQSYNRCRDARGVLIFTDKPCEMLQAVPTMPAEEPKSEARLSEGRAVEAFCRHRSPEQLVMTLSSALQSHDVNRVAGLYHWVGMGSRQARGLMNRLARMSERETFEVRLLDGSPSVEDTVARDRWMDRKDPDWPQTRERMRSNTGQPDSVSGRAPVIRRYRRNDQGELIAPRPKGLPNIEIRQHSKGGATLEPVIMRMRRRAGCLWVSF